MIDIQIGDSRELIKMVDGQPFDCIMTSPPYWGLRDYGHDDQIGLESTLEKYLKTMLNLFDDIKLKLKDTGNCFVNLGDTYATHTGKRSGQFNTDIDADNNSIFTKNRPKLDIPEKCLCCIPSRFAWGMINPNWKLKDDLSDDDKNYVISELIKRKII